MCVSLIRGTSPRLSNASGGTIGATRAARATPDGYTLIIGHMGTHAAAPALYPDLAYDPAEDFAPIGLVAEFPEVLVTRKDFSGPDAEGFRRLCEG